MTDHLDRNARKFFLNQPLGLRESRELEELLSRHPAFDYLCYNEALTAFTLRLTDSNYWVTSGDNIQELAALFLRERGVRFTLECVYEKLAA